MGVVIAHHSHPLDLAMQEAQKVLKLTAKEKHGRDAFAIRLLRRSGEFTEAGYPFYAGEGQNRCNVLRRLEKLLCLMVEGKLSTRLPHRMAELRWAGFAGMGAGLVRGIDEKELDEARSSELKRMAVRHTKGNGNRAAVVKEVLLAVKKLYRAIQEPIRPPEEPESKEIRLDPWQTMIDLLLILRFMTGEDREED
jgi:hypothetical protein